MISNYFNLAEEPFGVTPDPRFLFLGKQHREAMASLAYGTENNRGFVALIAKPGMGKTSLLFNYLNGLPDKTRTAFVFRTDCDSREFIRHLLIDIGVDPTGKDLPAMHEALNQALAAEMRAGNRFVLVIDEAQNLDESVLESIRLLSNFETPWMKLMHIVLAGQPGLAEKLSRPSMAQLRQRISLVIRVVPLDREEVNAYIDHRLYVAGCKDPALFTSAARSLIAEHSGGIPRNVNNICFNAMSLACALNQKSIEPATVLEVLADFDLGTLIENPPIQEQTSAQPTCGQQPVEGKTILPLGRAAKAAITGAMVLALVTGVSRGDVRAANTTELINQRTIEQPPIPARPANAPKSNTSTSKEKLESVRVSEGQTLYRISVENFGRYDPRILAEIHSLNPRLIDPNHIQAGQDILMPSAKTSSLNGRRKAPEELTSYSQEVGKE